MPKLILHIDMDAFFASIEQLDNPELRGKPVAVGGGERGVVSAASYEIRKYGVRSAMPVARARKLCPHAVFTPVRVGRYREVSRKVMAALSEFSPVVEQASVDEAYMDATGLERRFGPPIDLAMSIKREVEKATGGLTCSVGGAPVRFVAKMASDHRKPDGVTIVPPDRVRAFLAPLPVGGIPGIGPKTLPHLHKLGIKTIGDILARPASFWEGIMGERGLFLHERAQGLGSDEIVPFTPAKSASRENTFAKDTTDREFLKQHLLRQADRVAQDLTRHNQAGRTVTLKIKFADFKLITRSRTLPHPTSSATTIHRTACRLLDEADPSRPIRLIGVGVSNFADPNQQLSLLGTPETKQSRIEQTILAIRSKFGPSSLTRAGTRLRDEE